MVPNETAERPLWEEAERGDDAHMEPSPAGIFVLLHVTVQLAQCARVQVPVPREQELQGCLVEARAIAVNTAPQALRRDVQAFSGKGDQRFGVSTIPKLRALDETPECLGGGGKTGACCQLLDAAVHGFPWRGRRSTAAATKRGAAHDKGVAAVR